LKCSCWTGGGRTLVNSAFLYSVFNIPYFLPRMFPPDPPPIRRSASRPNMNWALILLNVAALRRRQKFRPPGFETTGLESSSRRDPTLLGFFGYQFLHANVPPFAGEQWLFLYIFGNKTSTTRFGHLGYPRRFTSPAASSRGIGLLPDGVGGPTPIVGAQRGRSRAVTPGLISRPCCLYSKPSPFFLHVLLHREARAARVSSSCWRFFLMGPAWVSPENQGGVAYAASHVSRDALSGSWVCMSLPVRPPACPRDQFRRHVLAASSPGGKQAPPVPRPW